jgi:trans-aconitate methyltransferase
MLLGPYLAELDASPPRAILDVGCGYGSIPVWLAARYPQSRVRATDVADRYYVAGRAAAADLGLPNIAFETRDVLELKEEAQYDLVLGCNMMNFMNTPAKLETACANLCRAARPGGLVAVQTPHFWTLLEAFTRLPLLHFLPIGWQDRVARATGRRSLMTDNRHPALGEMRRAFARHGGRVLGVHPASWLARRWRPHLVFWVRR